LPGFPGISIIPDFRAESTHLSKISKKVFHAAEMKNAANRLVVDGTPHYLRK
jgi:hypothetical protein